MEEERGANLVYLTPYEVDVGSADKDVSSIADLESHIAEIWQDLLDVESLDRNDNLFEMGADSLLAIQFIRELRDKCGVELTINSLFMSPTIAGIAAAIKDAQRADRD